MVATTRATIVEVFGQSVTEVSQDTLEQMYQAVIADDHGHFVYNSKAGMICALTAEQFAVALVLEIATQPATALVPKLKTELNRRANARQVIKDVLSLTGEEPNEERVEKAWRLMENKRRAEQAPREVPLRRPLHFVER